jgi:GntR family transcriptional regulator/MocR family aminotransferase
VTPSHQFPLGMPMSLARRVELLEWAKRYGAVIVEDDYDGEFRFEGRPVESLKSLDHAGLVAYVGTFSKTLFPDLRIGYVVPPASLREPLWTAKRAGDWHSCMLTQTALGTFMLNGEFAKHLRRMHKAYAERRATLIGLLTGELAGAFEPMPATAGIHLVARLASGWDEDEVVKAALDASVGVYGIGPFYAGERREQGVLVGYGGASVDAIEGGFRRLAKLMPALRR